MESFIITGKSSVTSKPHDTAMAESDSIEIKINPVSVKTIAIQDMRGLDKGLAKRMGKILPPSVIGNESIKVVIGQSTGSLPLQSAKNLTYPVNNKQ